MNTSYQAPALLVHQDLFHERPALTPTIYAYTDTRPDYAGLLKIGYTTASERVKEQYPVALPTVPYSIILEEPAVQSAWQDALLTQALPMLVCINTMATILACGMLFNKT